MARERIDDVAFHVVHLQESFVSVVDKWQAGNQQQVRLLDSTQAVLDTLSSRVEALEKQHVKPATHDIFTPMDAQATTAHPPGTPGFAPRAPPRAQVSPDHGDAWHTEGDPWAEYRHNVHRIYCHD